MSRILKLENYVKSLPVPKAIVTISTSTSGRYLNTSVPSVDKTMIDCKDEVEKLAVSNYDFEMVEKDGGYIFAVKTRQAVNATISDILGTLIKILEEALPNKEPTRTELWKFIARKFRHSDVINTREVQELILSIYDYALSNRDSITAREQNVHRSNFLGLMEHIRSKYGNKR